MCSYKICSAMGSATNIFSDAHYFVLFLRRSWWILINCFCGQLFWREEVYPYYCWTSLHLMHSCKKIMTMGSKSEKVAISPWRRNILHPLCWGNFLQTCSTITYRFLPKKFPQRGHLRRFLIESAILAKSNGLKWLNKIQKMKKFAK